MIRSSGVLMFQIGGTVWKIPITVSGYQEMRTEKKRWEQILNDTHFSKYLPRYRNFLGMQIAQRLDKVETPDNVLIKDYFKQSFTEKDSWGPVTLDKVVAQEHLTRFMRDFMPEHERPITDMLKKILVPLSSAHGDFYLDNILTDGYRLFLIDWVRYNVNSSRYFDLIDFLIFSEKVGGQSWMSVWEKLYQSKPPAIFGIRVTPNIILAYAFWKMAEEIKTLYQRGKMGKEKSKKYENFSFKLLDAADR